ncbi:MAG: TonB-dependent receptor, partial [Bacteroidetes bacterium]|nr:TonB-dependent receptor [Bacteroidota bacterium]
LEQEFVPFENDSTGRIFYRNAATSTRKGIEIGLTAFLGRHFFGSVNYTFSDFSFKNYEVPGSNFDGNTLPGVPRHLGGVEIRYARPEGWYFSVGGQSISEIFANDSNENNSRAYLLANARVGFIQKFESWQLEPFAGVNNFFDARYNANVRINAGFDRFYEPAPGRNFFGGLKVRFSKME